MRPGWHYIGEGQEAQVYRGKLREISGIGGVIEYKIPFDVAKRKDINNPISEFDGHDLFCKHLVLSLLDKNFIKRGIYQHHHIPLPLGSFNGGYYYEFAEGIEGFPLEYIDTENDYRITPVQISEWYKFYGLFDSVGFNVGADITDPNDGRSGKNMVFLPWTINYETEGLHPFWKRIDVGSASLPFNYEKFEKNIQELRPNLNEDFITINLAAKFYHLNGNINIQEQKELEKRVHEFRSDLTSTKIIQ